MHPIGRRRCHPVGESVGQVAAPEAMPACVLVSPPWQQPAELTPFVIHESHTHSGELNPRCLCKITSSYRDSLLQSGFVCVCVCVHVFSDRVWNVSFSVLWAYHMCLAGFLSCPCICVFICHLWLIPAITGSGHTCKWASPRPSDGLWDPSSCLYAASKETRWWSTRYPTTVNTSLMLSPWSCSHRLKSHLWVAIGPSGTA